jgi:hypothetical protein
MKTIDEISVEKYNKIYRKLPDDGPEQDFIQSEFSRPLQAPTPLVEHD